MNYKPKLNCNNERHVAFIYSVVFNSRFSVSLILLLFLSFTIQPVHQAYANEDVDSVVEEEVEEITPDDVEPSSGITEEDSQDSDTEVLIEEPVIEVDSVILNDDNSTTTNLQSGETEPGDQIDNSESVPSATSSITENLSIGTGSSGGGSGTSASGSEPSLDSSSSTLSTLSTSSTSSTSTTETEDESLADISYSESGNDEVDISTSSDDFTEETKEPSVTEAQSLVTEDNYYQFNRQACVAIGDGTFHCSLNTGIKADVNAVVYAEMGERLNMEIFLRGSNGKTEQITSNDYDDTAPHYDAESRQIVWQRLIDDRYQIVQYDLNEGEEKQLTFSRSNNMEPKVSEEGIVWQAWDGSDWEIMYFDGTFTDQLTSNTVQDVAPAIDDGYVLWSVLGSEEQEAKVYSLASGETLNITGYEGGVIANPRFVLVYDTQFENGDIITQGFDPTTGLSKPIAAKAADDPIEIPDSDSTGETRALIQNKSTQEEEVDADLTKKDPAPGGNSTSTATSTISAEEDSTLDLSNLTPTTTPVDTELSSSTDAVEEDEVFELTDFDLILIDTPTTTDDTADANSESNNNTTSS